MRGKSDNKHAHTKFSDEIVFCGCHKAQPMSLKSLFGTKIRTPPYRWDILSLSQGAIQMLPAVLANTFDLLG